MLLHDIAKPPCTRVAADGQVISPGHAGLGARLIHDLLWADEVSVLLAVAQRPIEWIADSPADRQPSVVEYPAGCPAEILGRG